jgi:hypothetical protein
MRLDHQSQPTPASLVGRWVDTPAREFKTKWDAYRGKMISVDTARAQHVVVKFQDDPTIKFFFPVTSVVKWLVDPSDHHPDDEELLRTGIQAEMATTTRLARVTTGRTTLAERRTAENHLMVRQQARL